MVYHAHISDRQSDKLDWEDTVRIDADSPREAALKAYEQSHRWAMPEIGDERWVRVFPDRIRRHENGCPIMVHAFNLKLHPATQPA